MIRHHFELRETIATILAERQEHLDAACEALRTARHDVERTIAREPFFQATFEPFRPQRGGKTVLRMAGAAESAGVGPMAAVAGAIAWAGVEAMVGAGARFGVIDNGGDIALVSDREVRVGLHAGDAPVSDRFAFVVPPCEQILGICTSSATVGPSISFGIADAVTVFSPDVALADAWATAVCNRITPDDQSVLDCLDPAGVTGLLAIIGEWTCSWGSVPRLVRAEVDEELITAGYGRLLGNG
ncbi:MAG: UPF0280 family protein [Methanoregulaceae archaeon]|nr:UPF0280 family protein [Methanoregulaceae archaeon]